MKKVYRKGKKMKKMLALLLVFLVISLLGCEKKTTEPEDNSPEAPEYNLFGYVMDEDNEPVEGAFVFVTPDTVDTTDEAGYYELSYEGRSFDVTFYAPGFVPTTYYGITGSFDATLLEAPAEKSYYTGTVHIHLSGQKAPLYLWVHTTNGASSPMFVLPPETEDTTVVVEDVPEGEDVRVNILGNTVEDVFNRLSPLFDVTGDFELVETLYTSKPEEMNIVYSSPPSGFGINSGTHPWLTEENLPEVVNGVYPLYLYRTPDIPEDITWVPGVLYLTRSNSILVDNFNLTVFASDMQGNRLERVMRNIPLDTRRTVYVSNLMEIPRVELDSVVGSRPYFSWHGNANLYVLSIGTLDDGERLVPVWEGITQKSSLAFPALPEGVEILSPGTYYFALRSLCVPGFDLNLNNDLANLLERGFSPNTELEISGKGRCQMFTID